jgi:hypothetical protein
MRWILGIVLSLLTVVGVNVFMLYKALQNPVQVETSYTEGQR